METGTIVLIATAAVLLVAIIVYINVNVVIVKQGTKKVVERFGVYRKTLDEGIHLIVKPFDKIAPIPWKVFSDEEEAQLKHEYDFNKRRGKKSKYNSSFDELGEVNEDEIDFKNAQYDYKNVNNDSKIKKYGDEVPTFLDTSFFTKKENLYELVDYVDLREQFLFIGTENTYPYSYEDKKFNIDQYPNGSISAITKDNASITLNACVFYQVTDVFNFYYGANNPYLAIKTLAKTTLRNLIGNMTLEEVLVSRATMNTALREVLDKASNPWGIKVNRVEIVEIVLSDDLKNAMNDVLVAEREKRARILRAEGEATSILRVREAEAEGYTKIKEASLDEAVLRVRSYEAIKDLANGQATKIFVPNGEISSLVTGSHILADALNENKNTSKEDK